MDLVVFAWSRTYRLNSRPTIVEAREALCNEAQVSDHITRVLTERRAP